ncbi:MBL fold metallo-hydrolase [Streptomyces sp. NPDC056149]|uniref:MBL fold metallo-hydrolase n=1 Tax=Streptomyces sp. NPDC056149 TaxID=3345728 RepID=UPI0035DDE5BB
MELTKKTHACVRIVKDGQTLVIDPAVFSEEDAAVGADAILVTHEHMDHFNEERLRRAMEANPAAEIWTLASVAGQISAAFPGRVHTVGEGDAFTAAGFEVEVHGQMHAVIHPDIPRITNVGFLLDGGAVFHPGDALTVPEGRSVDTLLLPVHAPWNKIAEVIDYVRAVAPRRSVDIHDSLLQDHARPVYDGMIEKLGGAGHDRLAPGAHTEVG